MQRDSARFVGFGANEDPGLSERGLWVYEMQNLGYNFRITDFQCALGISQLKRLGAYAPTARNRLAVQPSPGRYCACSNARSREPGKRPLYLLVLVYGSD
jgi:hypothetical protein